MCRMAPRAFFQSKVVSEPRTNVRQNQRARAGLLRLMENFRAQLMSQPVSTKRHDDAEAFAVCLIAAQSHCGESDPLIINTQHGRVIQSEVIGAHNLRHHLWRDDRFVKVSGERACVQVGELSERE